MCSLLMLVGASVAVELDEVRGGQVVGVAEHGVGEGAEGGREAEVLGASSTETSAVPTP
jgi:hypothetical protein